MTPNLRKPKDAYGYLVEIDAGRPADEYYGSDQKQPRERPPAKMGSFGRARWENATFVTGTDWNLIVGQPIVVYAGNSRPSGRVYKWVSDGVVPANLDQGPDPWSPPGDGTASTSRTSRASTTTQVEPSTVAWSPPRPPQEVGRVDPALHHQSRRPAQPRCGRGCKTRTTPGPSARRCKT